MLRSSPRPRRIAAGLGIALVALSASAFAGDPSSGAGAEGAVPGAGLAPPAFRRPAWIGVTMARSQGGVAVEHVVRGSPAERGGVRAGDTIATIDGVPMQAPADVSRAVGGRRVGESVKMGLVRGGSAVDASLVLAPRPSGDEILRMDLVGAFAPAWTNVTPLSGAPASLASLKGRVVLVDFWASWCGPCRMVAPRLSALHDKLHGQGLDVVGITTDDAERAAVFAERHHMSYPVVVDQDGDTTKRYGVTGLPTMLLVDKRGVVREVFVGFDPSREGEIEATVRKLLAEPAPR